jgi:hypothetical protein
VRCNTLDIFHESDGVCENALIDALQNGSHWNASPTGDDAPGVVDMAAAVGSSLEEFAGDLKFTCNSRDIVLLAHDESLFG